MSKPREFWIGQKYDFNGYGKEKVWYASKNKSALDEFRAGNKINQSIHVIEKSAYQELVDMNQKLVAELECSVKTIKALSGDLDDERKENGRLRAALELINSSGCYHCEEIAREALEAK